MRAISIVGARPQFVKASIVCRAFAALRQGGLEHLVVHTGQHYDVEMSASFFRELEIPDPNYNLEVGSGTHAVQTAEMMKRLEPILSSTQPDWVLLYGDTNSTLAGAMVAAKLRLPLAHIEAGLRSFNRAMPEEVNRIAADHLSDLLFCPTQTAVDNLTREGLAERCVVTGDVMYDAALAFRDLAESRGGALAEAWPSRTFALATVHRAENTDDPARLRGIFTALEQISREICPVVLPLHPRTRKFLEDQSLKPKDIHLLPPISYLDMLLLESRARFILTDSGGVQKEAYFVKTPCVTLRDETEWVETLRNGCNALTGADPERIVAAARNTASAGPWDAVYGDGQAGAATWKALIEKQHSR